MLEALLGDGRVLPPSVADRKLEAGMPSERVTILGEGIEGALHG